MIQTLLNIAFVVAPVLAGVAFVPIVAALRLFWGASGAVFDKETDWWLSKWVGGSSEDGGEPIYRRWYLANLSLGAAGGIAISICILLGENAIRPMEPQVRAITGSVVLLGLFCYYVVLAAVTACSDVQLRRWHRLGKSMAVVSVVVQLLPVIGALAGLTMQHMGLMGGA